MADCKKKIKPHKTPKGNNIGQGGNPDQYYSQRPAWNFSSCDKEKWSIYSKAVQSSFGMKYYLIYKLGKPRHGETFWLNSASAGHTKSIPDI